MDGAWWTRTGVLIALIVASAVILIPTFYPVDKQNPESWPGWYSSLSDRLDKRITPGLDLQGGLLLQYQVDVDRAISDRMDRYVEDLRRQARRSHPDAQVNITHLRGQASLRVTAEGVSTSELFTTDNLELMNLNAVPEAGGGMRLELDSDFVTQAKSTAIEQAIETIRRRIDAMGVAEPSLSRRGDTDIIVQMPGLSEEHFEQTKQLIGTTAQLQFKMVAAQDAGFFSSVNIPETEGISFQGDRQLSENLELLRAAFADVDSPAGTEVSFLEQERFNPTTGRAELMGYVPILLTSSAALTGEYITDARVAVDPQSNRPFVSIVFDATGARLFGDLTRDNVDRQMAIVLDGVVSSAPRINEPILGGRAQITMGSSGSYNEIYASAERLAIVLRNGALPAPIELQFETQVGPSLGADSVRSSAMAMTTAFIMVMIFIVAWYKLSGFITIIALLLNIIFIFAALALFNATLTLPGIAGITLTIGMAVDANIIIFERVREELRAGKTFKMAIHEGYDKAFTAILDSNLTTAIACIVLWSYGSGPIRGFAVTLLIGITCSLYTALLVTRLIFDYLTDGAKISRLSI